MSDLTDDNDKSSFIPEQINVCSGKSNEVLTDILQSFVRNQRALDNFKKRKTTGEALKQKIDISKKLTAGVLFNAKHVVMDEEVRDVIGQKFEQRDVAAMKKALRAFKEFKNRESRVKTMEDQGILSQEKFNGEQLKILLQWKKRKGDGPVPKSMKEKKQRWLSIKNRPDQTITEFLKDRKVFDNYKCETKGKQLTLEILERENKLVA